MRYSLEDFLTYIKNNNIDKLPEETIEILSLLENQVGAPEYSKAPQFKHNVNNFNKKKKSSDHLYDDWDTIRNFQPTEIVKREGLDVNLYQVRKLLNMLSDKNYDKISNDIMEQFDFVIKNKTPNDLYVLSNLFYEITSSNLLYSSLSAKLYCKLVTKSENLLNILNNNINNSETKINNIKYTDPEINYDKFCEDNKSNEKIRAEFGFYTNLMKNKLINYKTITNIIDKLFSALDNYIESGNKKNELDEISEIIYLVIYNSYQNIKEDDNELYQTIYKKVETIASMKVKNTPGITNKCIFKHMDLLDELI